MSHIDPSTSGHLTWPPRTWGFVFGLLAASLATLIGLASRVEPETILIRALIGGVAVGVITRITASLAQTPPKDL